MNQNLKPAVAIRYYGEWLALMAVTSIALILSAGCQSSPSSGKDQPAVIRVEIETIMQKVADWQLAHPNKAPMGDWIQGPFLNGLFALGLIPSNERYIAEVEQIGRKLNWQVIQTTWVANDYCSPQTWLDLYQLKHDPAMIASTRKALDETIADTADADDDVTFKRENSKKWSWCDSLYMAPPAFARMGKITGDQKYFDYLDKWWWITSRAYYDESEHLFFRDQHWSERERSGPKVFWARGNGWVVGGLVRVLQDLPQKDPMRPHYEQQLREMCERLLELQQPDGLWTANLMDPNNPPGPESSGSGFFIYGLAWSINHGIIGSKNKPVVFKAWHALTALVKPDGQLTHVQPIGDSPKSFNPDSTMPYGVGAFLLAGSEVWNLSGQ